MASTSGNTDPLMLGAANNVAVDFENADGTTPQDLQTGATDGTKVLAVNACNTESSTVYVDVFFYDGSAAWLLGRVPVAAEAGTDGAEPSVNLLNPAYISGLDANGELFLGSGEKVQVAPSAAITASEKLTVVSLGGDY